MNILIHQHSLHDFTRTVVTTSAGVAAVHTADAKPACCSMEGGRVIGRTDKVLPQSSAQQDPAKVQI